VKLLAWNIQHGGGARLARIVEEISAYDPELPTQYSGFRDGGLSISVHFAYIGITFAVNFIVVDEPHHAERRREQPVFQSLAVLTPKALARLLPSWISAALWQPNYTQALLRKARSPPVPAPNRAMPSRA